MEEPVSPTSPNWDVIRTEFVCGNDTVVKLAEKYGVTEAVMTGRVYRGKWNQERKEIQARARAEANAELVTKMAAQISKSAALDLDIATGLKRQIMRHIVLADAAADEKPPGDPMAPLLIRQLASAADSAQKIGKLAVGDATSITETNAAVQVETPDYENLPDEEIAQLMAAREILDRLQGVQST